MAKALYPFANHFLNLSGLRYHYLDEGRGDPLVMLHGNPSWSFYYRNLILGLRDDYRTIVPDHIGCGLSDKPDDSRYEYSLRQRVADLEALLDHLELRDNLTLILHDWGGMIGMAFAHRHPERIKRLVILNTAAFPLPAAKCLPWSLRWCRMPLIGPLLVRGLNAFCRGAVRYCVCKPMPAEVRKFYLVPYDCWRNRIAVLRFVQDIPLAPHDRGFDLVKEVADGLHRFASLPMLICWGEHDFVFDRHFLAEWRRRFPNAEVRVFPDAGHYVLEDAGAEILPLIRDFLRRHPLASIRAATVRERETAPLPHGRGSDAAVNIASSLVSMAQTQPQTLAIAQPFGRDGDGRICFRHFTYHELNAESDALARGFEQIGIGRGVRTVLMVTPSLEFFALTFALFKVGAVIVLIDPGMGLKNLGVCLAEAQPEAFVGISKAHLARILFGWGRSSVRVCVTAGRRFGWGGWTLEQVRRLGGDKRLSVLADTRAEEMAAILFTSGSTGVAKGVVYTHGIFAAQVESLRCLYGIEAGEIDLPTFPLFGLFGPALGMTSIVPEMDATRPAHVDPGKILDAIRFFGVTNLFGSPALIQRVGRYAAERGVQLPKLRRVISAGAPVPWQAIQRFASLLPGDVQVHTPYGATEALPVCSIGSDEILRETRLRTAEGAGVCVGRPVAGTTVKIIRISDEPIPKWSDDLEVPAGDIGEIVVQGPVVTASYWNRPESTALAKIADPIHGGFYHRMGDVGYVDASGRLWFCGRKSQRVVTPSGTLFTVPCEGVFNSHPAVHRTALVGVTRNGIPSLVLCVERDKEITSPSDEELRRELLAIGARHEHTRAIRTILFHPSFPVDTRHNAKIFREKLALWAAERLS
ncbi:MAG TPA: fatty acid CoA ligase family protein [Gemmataceae bacterium]|nr:fatty acid CoA ligase family protein [Gemmataceae bacterium]